MSRIGKQPVELPGSVEARLDDGRLVVKGPLGELCQAIPEGIAVTVEDNRILVERRSEEKPVRALHGTIRSLAVNMVEGVSNGYKRELEISGVGFRAEVAGNDLTMTLGFSHPVKYRIPEAVKVEVRDNIRIEVSGIDKQQVGQVAARIRGFCPAEPYKGKGIKYKDEQIRRKAGKTVA